MRVTEKEAKEFLKRLSEDRKRAGELAFEEGRGRAAHWFSYQAGIERAAESFVEHFGLSRDLLPSELRIGG